MSKSIKLTERGWPAHFIAVGRCVFRRNTLIECGDQRVVVSTVGNMRIDGKTETIGPDRYYETMAFAAMDESGYVEADIDNKVQFDSPWTVDGIRHDTDQQANDMHEAVVLELSGRLVRGDK